MKLFYAVCIFAVIALSIVTVNFRRESTNFYGIAETKEMVINAEIGVEISNMRITPGQQIRSGDTLVELRSPEIELKVSEFTHLISEIKTRSTSHANLSRSEVRQLKNEHESRIIEIHSELQQLESQYEINRQLMKKLRSISPEQSTDNADSRNPMLIKIQNLKKELERLEYSKKILDENLRTLISFGVDPLQEQLKQYEDQLRLYNAQRKKLYITAPNDGIIGAVFFKKGEMVSAFDSIATLHSESPSFVLGYIHENIYSSVSLGQKVTVRSTADRKNEVVGTVIGVGTRIVEYPVRLRKVPEVQMWGREVTIRIPEKNQFLLGEKVIISIQDEAPKESAKGIRRFSNLFSAKTLADTAGPPEKPTLHTIRQITVSENSPFSAKIEASGALYLRDIKRYCIISDESPMLYIMDSCGTVEKEVSIDGLDKIDDMEGITEAENGTIYIVCSQNPTKKGKIPSSRRLLVRLQRDGYTFRLTGQIKLLDLLTEAAKKDEAAPWTPLIKVDAIKRTPDIEGIASRGGAVYLSFKSPLLGNDMSAILKIDNIDTAISTNTLKNSTIELWQQLPLKDEATGLVYRISDIQFIQGNLYILSCGYTATEIPQGRLWVFHPADQRLEAREDFRRMKPEGIALHTDSGSILITFDNGSDQVSQFMVLKDVL